MIQHSAFSIQHYLPRRGFSFTEILFAIMILGIGFIMVAAIFPVSIQQTQLTNQETVGAAIAREGVAHIGQLAQNTWIQANPPAPQNQVLLMLRPTLDLGGITSASEFQLWKQTQPPPIGNPSVLASQCPPLPATGGSQVIPGQVWSLDYDQSQISPPGYNDIPRVINQSPVSSSTAQVCLGNVLWSAASQNMIQVGDPRFAWVAFYKRDLIETFSPANGVYTFSFAPYAQVICIATQVRNAQTYGPQDLALSTSNPITPVSLQPSLGPTTITAPSVGLGYEIQFQSGANNVAARRAAEGAFIVIATDTAPTNNAAHNLLAGHVYRLGAQDSSAPNKWEFAPGYGPIGTDQNVIAALSNHTIFVYIVGLSQDPQDPQYPNSQNYSGVPQDIAVYSTFVPCSSN